MWISGLETVKHKIGISLVYDLSATPFFLRGSGYIEGTLFPWTMSDFSLMDAIESGVVKLPRVPVADNVPGGDTPKFRNLWDEIKKSPHGLPKKGRSASRREYDPLSLFGSHRGESDQPPWGRGDEGVFGGVSDDEWKARFRGGKAPSSNDRARRGKYRGNLYSRRPWSFEQG